MSSTNIGRFTLRPIKCRDGYFAAEISVGAMNYLGLLIFGPVSKKWAITFNAFVTENSKDWFRYASPSTAIKEFNCRNWDRLEEVHLEDWMLLDESLKTGKILTREQKETNRLQDFLKLQAVVNDSSKSEGVREAARRKLATITC